MKNLKVQMELNGKRGTIAVEGDGKKIAEGKFYAKGYDVEIEIDGLEELTKKMMKDDMESEELTYFLGSATELVLIMEDVPDGQH